MVRCSVLACKSDSEKKVSGISFHSFPENEELRKKWIIVTGRTDWLPMKHSRICSLHFPPNKLIKKKKLTVLLPDALPIQDVHENLPDVSIGSQPMEIDEDRSSSRAQVKNFDETLPNISGPLEVFSVRDDSPVTGIEPQTCQVIETGKSPNYSPRTLKRKLKRSLERSAEKQKKLKAAREKCRRLTKKVAGLKNIITELKAKCIITEEDGDLLESIDPVNKDFLKKFLAPQTCDRKYSPSLRKFALCLNFISPRAYKYVRQQFDTCLPHPSTLSSWYKGVDANPGFTTESLDCIKLLAKRKKAPLYGALSMDEMAIRTHVQWDGEKCVGLVNYGEALDGYNVDVAKEALVFMLTSLNDSWKIPVGYFLINGCNGEQKANLTTQCINLLIDSGAVLLSLTFDGCPANLAMAKILGAKIDSSNNIVPFFKVQNQEIVIIPDPSHMLKLVRNTLGQKKIITNGQGQIISWSFIEKLNELQENEGLHLANRLKNQHINFTKQIMKVKLAAQTFSKSVAASIEFCNKNLKLSDFSESDATVEFITKINDLFDVLNSRNLNAYGFKKPIGKKNGERVLEFLKEIEYYILGLQLEGRSIMQSNRRVGFLGLLICIKSLEKIYTDKILTDELQFLPFYKLSQDHLECFFSAIRSKGGFNNNPTAMQFLSAYKRLVIHGEIKSISTGNCIPLEDIKILTHTEVNYERKINNYTYPIDHTPSISDSPDLKDHDYFTDPSRLSIYVEETIPYIAGFVVRKIQSNLKCEDCLLALVGVKNAALILKRDKGGLTYPSQDVIKICTQAERNLRWHLQKGISFFSQKNLIPQLILSVLKRSQSVFINEHFNEQPFIGNHRILLIKAIASRYLNIRIHHATKIIAPKEKIRNFYNKLVLFKGQ